MDEVNLDRAEVKSREDFIRLVYLLSDDYKANADRWENASLDAFLDALAAWASDMDGYYAFWKKESPKEVNWSVIWDMLVGARDYS